jgi:hypothetical protein
MRPDVIRQWFDKDGANPSLGSIDTASLNFGDVTD